MSLDKNNSADWEVIRMKNQLIKQLKCQRGSAAVMVISVILILTTLGIVALMGSVSSVKMGARFKNWSEDFYTLDQSAEDHLSNIDLALQKAELKAREYMESESFSNAAYTDTIVTAPIQAFFVANTWMNQTGNSYDAYIIANPGMASADLIALYKLNLEAGYKTCFEKIYYLYLSHEVSSYLATLPGAPNQEVKEIGNNLSGFMTPLSKTWATYLPVEIPLAVQVVDASDAKKSVDVEIRIIIPEYKTIVQTVNKPIKGNPLHGYAIVAGGNITTLGDFPVAQIQVGGDMIASGGNFNVGQNGRLNVYGNVYANGDVALVGSSSRLQVFKHSSGNPLGAVYTKKMGIYGASDLGILESDGVLFNRAALGYLISPTVNTDAIPFFYRDLAANGWGNVYAHNLLIDDSVQSGTLIVDGNITTSDDIEMNGVQNNTITINGNYVGISSEGAYISGTEIIDPNKSSTVLNNQVLRVDDDVDLNNKLVLNGGVIVPGTAFREFDGTTNTRYYQTIESITGRDRTIFDTYVAEPDDLTAVIYDLTTDGVTTSYGMKTLDATIEARRSNFFTALNSASIKTNVVGTSTMKGYGPGAVVMHLPGVGSADIYVPGTNPIGGNAAFSANQLNWNTAKGSSILENYFKAKTETFGFRNRPLSSLITATPPNAIAIAAMNSVNMYYLSGNSSFDITGKNGIVFCEGNLVLYGTGTFNGVIIASGNITLSPSAGAFDIKYDETVVSNILADDKAWAVRAFFEPGMIGVDDYAFYKDFHAGGATKTFLKRYSIAKWKEVYLP